MTSFYKLKTDATKFANTQGLWNHLYLDDPWSIGYVSNLIETSSFQSKSYWEQFYFESGEERNRIVADLPVDQQQLLNDELFLFQNREMMMTLADTFKAVNYEHGRTRSQLNNKATLLHQICRQHHIEINEQECIDVVNYRVIGETWNNMMQRKQQVIEHILSFSHQDSSVEKTDFDTQKLYAVDFEIKQKQELLCAIQIKPTSFFSSLSEKVLNAQSVFQKKHEQYQNRFGKQVHVIAFENDQFADENVIKKIKDCIQNHLQAI